MLKVIDPPATLPDEAERLAALREYAILDTPAEAAFDRITALAADLFDTPIAVVSLIDSDRQWFKSVLGLAASETPREHAFCDHTIRSDEVMVVPDAEADARFADNPLVTGDPNIRFYAGAPLRLSNGLRLGSLCVIGREPRAPLTEVEKRRLAILAQVVVDEMDFRLTTARLEAARRQAEAASEAKSEFLANMSHEVRTPLTGIIGFAGILGISPNLSDRDRGLVSRIGAASNNLLAIVNDVLDLARMESGQLQMALTPQDILPIVTAAADLVSAQAAEKGIALQVVSDGVVPPVSIDAARLRQVVLNLVSNAVKFTEAGGVTVTVSPHDGGLRIAVRDTGIGIDPAAQDQIFERFVQADGAIHRKFGGTGLGLAISRRLAEAMGGALSVESAPGQGATFRLDLPAA